MIFSFSDVVADGYGYGADGAVFLSALKYNLLKSEFPESLSEQNRICTVEYGKTFVPYLPYQQRKELIFSLIKKGAISVNWTDKVGEGWYSIKDKNILAETVYCYTVSLVYNKYINGVAYTSLLRVVDTFAINKHEALGLAINKVSRDKELNDCVLVLNVVKEQYLIR